VKVIPPDRDRARGALLGTFVGDALGMPFEGLPPDGIPTHFSMENARLGPGTYPDDTQMMIALGEAIVAADTVDEDRVARAFLDAYDPRRGYGRGTVEVFGLWRAGVPTRSAAKQVFDGGSFGNGAAMRIAPVAVRWCFSALELAENAARSARLTHAHRLGGDAAVVLAGAIAAALNGRDVLGDAAALAVTPEMQDAISAVRQLVLLAASPAEVAERLGNTVEGHRSVPAALYAAVASPSFKDAVTFAVRCGGDTDTIAAMAGAIAGAQHGAAAVPADWFDALENGLNGRDAVLVLADALWARATRGAGASS
jgi:poly(ADP-ribose) glycohydrolase ARH3